MLSLPLSYKNYLIVNLNQQSILLVERNWVAAKEQDCAIFKNTSSQNLSLYKKILGDKNKINKIMYLCLFIQAILDLISGVKLILLRGAMGLGMAKTKLENDAKRGKIN